jgi:hypothetical protein
MGDSRGRKICGRVVSTTDMIWATRHGSCNCQKHFRPEMENTFLIARDACSQGWPASSIGPSAGWKVTSYSPECSQAAQTQPYLMPSIQRKKGLHSGLGFTITVYGCDSPGSDLGQEGVVVSSPHLSCLYR